MTSEPLLPIAPDVWHVPAPSLRLPGGARMPIASTLVRLPDRSLLLYSPVPLDDARAAAIAEVGEVAHVVAPNLWHHLYVKAASERYPRATVHGAPGLAHKRADLKIDRELSGADPAWGDALDALVIDGAPKLNETVLFHRPSGTLVCADLVFNLPAPETFMSRVLFGMTGVGGGKLAQSRAWKVAVRDRTAARASIDRMLSWEMRRVSPVHGDVIEVDRAGLGAVMARAYGGAP